MVPDHSAVVHLLFSTGLFNLRTHEGSGAFVDAVVSALHAIDENFGHLRKNRGQTSVHGHGEDAALYKMKDGTAYAVDFVQGAGGDNPKPRWGVDTFPYTHNDWLDPTIHGVVSTFQPARVPSYAELGDDAFFRAMIGVPLFADYLMADAAGHPDAKPNDGMSVWFSRATYRLMAAFLRANGQPIDPAGEVRIVRNEWREQLRLPPV